MLLRRLSGPHIGRFQNLGLLNFRPNNSDAPQQGGEESPIFRVIDELRDQIFQRFPDVITADAKYLAYLFTEVRVAARVARLSPLYFSQPNLTSTLRQSRSSILMCVTF